MAKKLKGIVLFLSASTVILSILYQKTAFSVLLSLAITCGTATYHIGMRFLVGLIFSAVMKNRADYSKRWYQVGNFEMAVYEKLHVKNWKRKLLTYDSTLFDPRIHS